MTTQTESTNVELVKRGFAAFAAADMATLAGIFDPNVQWISSRTGMLDGNYDGWHALSGFFAQLATETDGTFASRPLTFAGSGDDVFVNASAAGKRKGRSLEQDEVLIFTLKDGRVQKVRAFLGDHAAAERFWA